MSATIFDFATAKAARAAATVAGVDLAATLGSPDDWYASAFQHLETAIEGRYDGAVTVSAAALHIVLAHLVDDPDPSKPDGAA